MERPMSYLANPLTDYSPQLETGGPVETSGGAPGTAWFRRGAEKVFSEEEELDLASEFLEIRSERDLDHFVGALIGRADRATNAKLDEPVERDLGGIFKKLGRAILPMADPLGILGGGRSHVPGGGLGAGIGHALGLELEGLSPEDGEFEVAKQFVRFAGGAIKNAQEAGSTGDPAKQAHDAAESAAQLHAPGLIDSHGALSVDRPAERPDRSARPAPSPRPNGEKTMESYERGQSGPYQGNGGAGRSLSEEELTNLASELMNVTNEQEFENFLGDLISKGVQAIGKFVSSPTGKALGGALKDAAKTLLPIAGTAVGTYFGGPIGAQIGGTLGSAASNLFEAEAEAEEREWEAANVFVRVAVDAVNNAADAPAHANPHDVAHHAVSHAMRRYAPYAPWHDRHDGAATHHGRHRRHEGSWVRHGHTIIVHGVV
jgi:hypothetical protein